MYKRSIWIIFSCIAVLITIFLSSCSTGYPLGIKDKPIKKAINYMYGAQSPDGSIGSYSDTAWSVMHYQPVEIIRKLWVSFSG
jgi:hypothetical protein